MASLQNAQIDQSYQGLIKTADNTSTPPFPPVALQYGDGTDLPIKIGDGTGVGIGDVVTIESGTRNIDLNSQNLGLNGLTSIDAAAGTANIINGTYNFGNAFTTTNVDFSNATVTGLPAGGGGAPGLLNTTRGLKLNTGGSSNEQWRLSYVPDTFSTTSTSVPDNQLKIVAMQMQEGMTIGDVTINVVAAGTGTVDLVLYKSALDADGNLTGGALEVNFGTVDISTTGQKIITGANHTLGSTQDDVYFIGVYNSSGGSFSMQAVSSTNLGGVVAHGSLYASTMYRGYTFHKTETSLPSTISGLQFTKSTDFPTFGVRN